MKRTLLLLLTFIASPGFPQQRQLDSLLIELSKHRTEDTVRLEILNRVAAAYAPINPQKGIDVASMALELAGKLDSPVKRAEAQLNMGLCYRAQTKDSLAMVMFKQSLAAFVRFGYAQGMAMALHNIGILHFNLADYEQALEHQERARRIAGESGDKEIMAAALNSIGVVYLSLADYPRALEYFQQSLGVFEEMRNKPRIGNAFTNLGIVYRRMLRFPKALEYNERALQVYEELGNKQGVANVLGNVGNVYDDMDSTAQALAAYEQSLALNDSLGNRRGAANALLNIGITHSGKRDYALALDYLNKAQLTYEQLGDKNSLAAAHSELAKIYRDAPLRVLQRAGVSAARRYPAALEHLDRGLALGREIGAVDKQMFVWLEISKTYEAQRAYARALDAYKNYIVLHDSIMNDEKREELTQKAMQFEFDKREALLKADHDKQQLLAAEEIKRQNVQRNAILGGGSVLLLAAVTIFAFYKKRRDAEDARKEAEFNALVSDTEMKALRSQMNPHFIFNSLNSIGDYITKHDVATADHYLTKFAKLMRLILQHSERKEVPLADDLQGLDLYLQLESLRLNRRFHYEIRVDEDIDREATMIPPLMLQPFVENSIWHGLSMKQGEGRILIDIKEENEMIVCTVEDNGIGRKQAALLATEPAKESLGMKITNARIDIINRMKQAKATMNLFDLPEGTRVELKLPLVVNG